MVALELALLMIAYTALIISLTFGIICYKRNIEPAETIVFTLSLLLLIISISVSPLCTSPQKMAASDLSISLCMVLVSSATLLNTLSERIHTFPLILKKTHTGISAVLFIAAISSYFTGHLFYTQWVIVLFLVLSIVTSMMIIRVTRPQKAYVHLEKSNRIFAVAFLILVPLYVALHYGLGQRYTQLQIGFILPAAFILLAVHKAYDDLKRLSIIRTEAEPRKQQFTNYGLTDREREVAGLLFEGRSYQSIAERLFISVPTVKTHTSSIYRKCSVKNRYELIKLLS